MISEILIAAIMLVESSGGRDTRNGDGGRAVGPLQIHASVVRDVNRIAGTRYTHAQMRDPAIARDVFRRYVSHYATPARLGRPVTDQDIARIWNGGPQGWRKPATRAYWRRVQHAMNDLRGTPPR